MSRRCEVVQTKYGPVRAQVSGPLDTKDIAALEEVIKAARKMMRPYTILVTGSRTWVDYVTIRDALVAQWMAAGQPKRVVVMHGNARGADRLADRAARELGFTPRKFWAPWKKYGKRAGYIRNAWMVKKDPHVCLAFIRNESRGATMCAQLASDRGIEVHRFTRHNGSIHRNRV